MDLEEHRLSFGAAAEHYDRVRPGYPAAAVSWAIGLDHARVADLGAGTGLLTRAIRDLGHEVTAVEPDPGMRAALIAATPGVPALDGSAEATGLPAAGMDAVLAGAAYHWFKPELAHPEIARILRAGGHFAALWNDRDDSVAWIVELNRIIDDFYENRRRQDQTLDLGEQFGPVESAEFTHQTWHTPQSLLDLIKSRSYYLVADSVTRQRLIEQVRQLTVDHPDLAGRETFELPYVTRVRRAARR
jgi:SAM-dependent methyltransferase